MPQEEEVFGNSVRVVAELRKDRLDPTTTSPMRSTPRNSKSLRMRSHDCDSGLDAATPRMGARVTLETLIGDEQRPAAKARTGAEAAATTGNA